ncbi:hypothetical protein LguiB_024157 [Lonicera macranthoides]
MGGVIRCYSARPSPLLPPPRLRFHGFRCCVNAPNNNNNNKKKGNPTSTPQLLKFAVNGVTELLRFFSFSTTDRLEKASDLDIQEDELLVSGIDDVLTILKSDYAEAYFVTGFNVELTTLLSPSYIGVFTSAIYAEDCIFEDPTIKFRGKELYSRNLKLLVPFFDQPSITLQKIEKGNDSGANFVLASWSLRTYLKLPWKPLISIDGSTIYDLDDDLKIVKHAESWSISALEAVGQIFTPTPPRVCCILNVLGRCYRI